ncbi:hypothetical protein vBVpaPMGD2_6 [Vibrio phage vB_VpaP_MGD2]|uniref:Uncharacterized protein n=1 Tax=Vibrio phage vB_VpaP_MGD2 TaxID=2565877 RepID=A0A6B7HXR1_9CAUD|nr:hypothetical protein vBVpaPMGD2_6 [Vibrio phage vB_VpaP_MGD2]
MSRFDKPSSVIIPAMKQLAPEAKGLTTADLNNPEHPVNINSQSGKRAGMALMIGSKIYVATGVEPHDPWDASGTGGSSNITVDAPNEPESSISGITLGDGMSYILKGTKAVLHAAVTEQEHKAVESKADSASSAAEQAGQEAASAKQLATQAEQKASSAESAVEPKFDSMRMGWTDPNNVQFKFFSNGVEKQSYNVSRTGLAKALAPSMFTSVTPDKDTKTIKFTDISGSEHTVDLSDWFTDTGGGTNPTVKYHLISGFFPKGGTKDEATIKANITNDREVADANNVWIDDTRPADGGGSSASEDKYMFVWLDDRLGEVRGFEFSGFLSVWDDITPVTVDGNAGKLYISPNPTFAAEVSYKVVMK